VTAAIRIGDEVGILRCVLVDDGDRVVARRQVPAQFARPVIACVGDGLLENVIAVVPLQSSKRYERGEVGIEASGTPTETAKTPPFQ
jgi:hypothetical protein